MKPWQTLAFGILVGLLATGLILLVSSPQRGEPIQLPPVPTPAPIIVDISGAVNHPGVYELPIGSRVQDAIEAAGGLQPEAFTESLNLAAPLYDGSKVLIPVLPQVVEQPDEGGTPLESQPQTIFPININTATLEQLIELPGIGEVKAQAIIDYRNANGPFTNPEQIMNVRGIGQATYEAIKDLITVY